MQHRILVALLVALAVRAQSPVEPVTPNASPEARALLKTLHRFAGRNILSGQHNTAESPMASTEKIHEATGRWPALWSVDLDPKQGAKMVAEARRQYEAGSMVVLNWSPSEPKHWNAEADKIAGLLAQLRDAHVPVIWRPLGDAAQSPLLYQQLFDLFAVERQLNNLLWLCAPSAERCDMFAIGARGSTFPQELHDGLLKMARGKLVGLALVDKPPTPEQLKQQPSWSFFILDAEAQPANLGDVMKSLRTVNRGDPELTPQVLASPEPQPCTPVNPHATDEARALLKKICAISGKYILTGQHNFPNERSRRSDSTAEGAGKYPYIWGSDFGFTGGEDKDSILHRDLLIEEAKKQYAAGSIITLMWHVVRPTEDEPVQPVIGWRNSVQAKLTDEQWAELTTPGTELNQRWTAQVDVVAGYLKRLQEAKMPVIWRPYHEANGNWFWWGSRAGENGYIALYRMLYDRFVNVHHLDNLLWVYNSNAPTGGNVGSYADFYPGPRFCDILATDVYGEFKQSYHDELAELAAGKPIALGEVGRMPAPSILQAQPKWCWFMVWADMFHLTPADAMHALFDDPHTLSRGAPLP